MYQNIHELELDEIRSMNNSNNQYQPVQSIRKTLILKKMNIWYEDYLPQSFRGQFMPEEINIQRNYCFIALSIQFFCSIIGFLLYFVRRNRFLIIINLITLVLTFTGFYGVAHIHQPSIMIHALITTGFMGSFFVYSLIEAFFLKSVEDNQSLMNETIILMLMSLPYLVDFTAGITIFKFLVEITDLQESRNQKLDYNDSNFIIPDKIQFNPNDPSCIICTTETRNSVLYKCGHKLMCEKCAEKVKQRFGRCPVCRYTISDVIIERT